jgi:hypothetical protein
MKDTTTSSWTNHLRHGAHQVADVVVDVVRDVAQAIEVVRNASSRRASRSRRRSPPAPSSPPDDLTRARAGRILRDNGLRGHE